MLFKRPFLIALELFIISLFLIACSPAPTSNAVQLPEALKLALGAVILAGVTLGLQVIFENFGIDLRGLGAAIAVTLSGFAIAQLQGLIDVIPAQYDQIVVIVLNILVVILGGLGFVRLVTNPSRAAGLLASRRELKA